MRGLSILGFFLLALGLAIGAGTLFWLAPLIIAAVPASEWSSLIEIVIWILAGLVCLSVSLPLSLPLVIQGGIIGFGFRDLD